MALQAAARGLATLTHSYHRLPLSLTRLLASSSHHHHRDQGSLVEAAKDSFGTLKLGVEDKELFHDYDFVPEDQDKQDEHEAKIADIYRPGSEKYLRKLNYLIHDRRDLRAALLIIPEMKKERVRPEQAHFRILINACSKVLLILLLFVFESKPQSMFCS